LSDFHKPSFPSGAGGVWFGPALAVLAAALLIWKPFEGEAALEEVAVSALRLEGELELTSGALVSVRLGPLHSDPGRQAFDKGALSRRLELPAGEPWSLRLEVAQDAVTAAPAQVRVRDQAGACLAPILSEAGAAGGAVQDPLFTLFRPSELEGETPGWELVLWGRAPGAGGLLECSWGAARLAEVSATEDPEPSVVNEGPQAPE